MQRKKDATAKATAKRVHIDFDSNSRFAYGMNASSKKLTDSCYSHSKEEPKRKKYGDYVSNEFFSGLLVLLLAFSNAVSSVTWSPKSMTRLFGCHVASGFAAATTF